VVEFPIGDVTSGFGRLLAAEIDKSPFSECSRKAHITCEWYGIETKHVMNTNRKHGHFIIWQRHFRSWVPPCGRNRYSAIIDNRNNGYNYRMVRVRQIVCKDNY
jgi:hypothetical protein